MTEQTQEQVAKTLKDSWLFYQACPASHSTENGDDSHEDCMLCKGDEKRYFKIPTADQAEAILEEMKLQVVKATGCWWLSRFIKYHGDTVNTFDCFESVLEGETCRDTDHLGQRTLANNAALAWCCDNMRAELELAISTINQK